MRSFRLLLALVKSKKLNVFAENLNATMLSE